METPQNNVDMTALMTEAQQTLSEATALLPAGMAETMQTTDFTSSYEPGKRRSAFPERGAIPPQPTSAEVAQTMDEALAAPVIIKGHDAPAPAIDEEQERWNAFARSEDVESKTS